MWTNLLDGVHVFPYTLVLTIVASIVDYSASIVDYSLCIRKLPLELDSLWVSGT